MLFVTGKCHWGCSYCPLSENRRETPDMFANERRCSTWEEVIEEGRAILEAVVATIENPAHHSSYLSHPLARRLDT